MEKRIQLEKRARKPNQITELNLDNCRSTSILGLTDEYTALESLSLINVGLTTLKGFPKLPNLKKLELSDNRISSGLNYLTTSPKIQYLNLSGNKIKDLETLKPLEEFKNLAVLDLFNNEATQIENYREKIFAMLPTLKFLDGFDLNEIEAPSDGDDDDEVNGNDSDEDDKKNAFCLNNGLEIDLDELEAFERRVQAKKKAAAAATTPTSTSSSIPTRPSPTTDETDDLDEYLKELKLRDELDQQNTNPTTNAVATYAGNSTASLPTPTITTTASNNNNLNFTILLYWLLAILNLANAAYFSECADEEGDEEDDDSDDDADDDNGEMSLAEVYNDNLEEDNSDWDEEDGVEDDDDDDSDEEEADGDSTSPNKSASALEEKSPTAAGPAESESRGKKRKHDG